MVIVAGTMALAIAGCGGGASESSTSTDPGSASSNGSGSYPIAGTTSFPPPQSLAQRAQFVVSVHNTGRRALPNVAVSVCNTTCSYKAPRGQGTTVQAFSYAVN